MALGLGVYVLSSWLVDRFQVADMEEAGQTLFVVVGVFTGLMLSLAFTEGLSDWRSIQDSVKEEAIAISDTFEVLNRFEQSTDGARSALLEYTEAVIEDDWEALEDDELSDRAGDLRRTLVDEGLALEPESADEAEVKTFLLDDLDAVSGARQTRLSAALAEPPVYTYVFVALAAVSMAFFGVYRPQPVLIGFAALFAGMMGVVVYLVVDLSDPFQGLISVDPTPLEELLEMMRTQLES